MPSKSEKVTATLPPIPKELIDGKLAVERKAWTARYRRYSCYSSLPCGAI